MIIVDIVTLITGRPVNLHDALMTRLFNDSSMHMGPELYAVAYRSVKREGKSRLEIWPERLALGRQLPTLPLGLPGGLFLPVNLEESYERTCRELRLDQNGD